MKRTLTSLIVITVFVVSVVVADLWFMSSYAKGMNERLEQIEKVETMEMKKEAVLDLEHYFKNKNFWAHRIVPTGRLEELETLLYKLNAYIAASDEHEVTATIAELRSRVNLLYSTNLYHWYHPAEFSIE